MTSDPDPTFLKPPVTVSGDKYPSWKSQAGQYPPKGSPGISYFRARVSSDYHVDCLLYRDETGELVGILNRYPADFPPFESAGNWNIWVRPDRQRKGIGTELAFEATRRWEPPDVSSFTERGSQLTGGIRKRFVGTSWDYRDEGWESWKERDVELDESDS